MSLASHRSFASLAPTVLGPHVCPSPSPQESGLTARDLRLCGNLYFEFRGDPQLLEVHVFTTSSYTGSPTESEEVCPAWSEVGWGGKAAVGDRADAFFRRLTCVTRLISVL